MVARQWRQVACTRAKRPGGSWCDQAKELLGVTVCSWVGLRLQLLKAAIEADASCFQAC